MGTPISIIYICSGVRLNSRYDHTIYFANREEQYNYFVGKVVKTFPAYSFIRKTWDLNVAATMEEAATWSYLFFQNAGNYKTYFYFIDNIEYVNDGTVRLKLQLDVLQTYMTDYKLLECFVERQHVEDDTIGANTVDEGLETGDLVTNSSYDCLQLKELCILVLASINPNHTEFDFPIRAFSGMYNDVFSGLKLWVVDSADWAAWGQKLEALSEAGYIDGIVAMWMYPKALIDLGGENEWGDEDVCKTVDYAKSFTINAPINGRDRLDGYTPKNNKLLCFPYNFLYVSNNSGGGGVFKYERFQDRQPTFIVDGALSPDAPVQIVPCNFNGGSINQEHAVVMGNFPSCAWNADVYKMWLAQNQGQHTFDAITGGVKVVAGAATSIASLFALNVTGAAAGAATAFSGVSQIGSLLAQKRDMEVQPPQARGHFSSNLNVSAHTHTFTFYPKSVSAENAKIIDDYFTMYGYKINRVQKPNIHARKSHTYVKTIGCHIDADLCNEDATKIEEIFDRGVTFWTNGDRIGNYSDDNSTL